MSIAAVGNDESMAILLQQLAQSQATQSSTANTTTGATSANSVSSISSTDAMATAKDLFARQFFALLDTNSDGKISAEEADAGAEKAQELLQSLTSQNLSESQSAEVKDAITKAFTKMDTDGDGSVSQAEFKTAVNQLDLQQLTQQQDQTVTASSTQTVEQSATTPPPQSQFALLSTLSNLPFVGSLATFA